MGTEASKENRKNSSDGNNLGPAVDFPNARTKDGEVTSWSLLHQCTVDNWKQGHAEAANFPDSILTCDRTLHKDCSSAFCMSRQGVINIDRPTSVFSFRRRTKFAKMAEHFEYNHIPAQMSSVNHFRVKSVLCFRDSLVVLHLSRNANSQFGLLDLSINKFLGVFGKQPVEYANENFSGELSPDKSKCLVLKPRFFRPNFPQYGNDDLSNYSKITKSYQAPYDGDRTPSPLLSPGLSRSERNVSYDEVDVHVPLAELLLFDMSSKLLLSCVPVDYATCHFSFDPRHSWRHLAITKFGRDYGENSLSSVELADPSSSDRNGAFSTFTASGATAAININTGKTHKSTEQLPKQKTNVTDWSWCITAENDRLSETWDDDNLVIGGPQRRHSSSSSSSSSSTSSSSFELVATQKLVDLRHSRDGRLLVATMMELGECRCREKRSGGVRLVSESRVIGNVESTRRFHQMRHHYELGHCHYHSNLPAVKCTLYIFDADTVQTLRCIRYHRYACRSHTCPTNYVPVFSACGTRMAVAMDSITDVPTNEAAPLPLSPTGQNQNSSDNANRRQRRRCHSPAPHYVQVYRLPSPALCLQALCRAVVLESRIPISQLTLPPKILNYLKFGPEFDY